MRRTPMARPWQAAHTCSHEHAKPLPASRGRVAAFRGSVDGRNPLRRRVAATDRAAVPDAVRTACRPVPDDARQLSRLALVRPTPSAPVTRPANTRPLLRTAQLPPQPADFGDVLHLLGRRRLLRFHPSIPATLAGRQRFVLDFGVSRLLRQNGHDGIRARPFRREMPSFRCVSGRRPGLLSPLQRLRVIRMNMICTLREAGHLAGKQPVGQTARLGGTVTS